MKGTLALVAVVLAAVTGNSFAEEKAPNRNARQTVAAYVDAVAAFRDAEAKSLGVEGTKPSRQKGIEEFRSALGGRKVTLKAVRADETLGRAAAVSDAQGGTAFVFLLSKKDGRWQVRDVDAKSPEKANEAMAKFSRRYSAAKDVPAGK